MILLVVEGLGTDRGGGHVDISFDLKVLLRSVCFLWFLFIFELELLFDDCNINCDFVMFRSHNVDISLVLIMCYKMHVFSLIICLNDFVDKSKEKKPTGANPMNSKQWKSLYICFFVF